MVTVQLTYIRRVCRYENVHRAIVYRVSPGCTMYVLISTDPPYMVTVQLTYIRRVCRYENVHRATRRHPVYDCSKVRGLHSRYCERQQPHQSQLSTARASLAHTSRRAATRCSPPADRT